MKNIRKNAYGYFHGHEVMGINPSLLEALGTTDLNILLDVGFNHEVGEKSALYFNKSNNNLASLINELDLYNENIISEYSKSAKERIGECYTWNKIISDYEILFLNLNGGAYYEGDNISWRLRNKTISSNKSHVKTNGTNI